MAKKYRPLDHNKFNKTIFLLCSVVVLGFLVLVVKYTSFSSEPKAAVRKMNLSTLLKKSAVDCANRYGFSVGDYVVTPPLTPGPNDRIKIGSIWNLSLNLFDFSWVDCYVYARTYQTYNDNYCSSHVVYDADGTYRGKKNMKCKTNCNTSSTTDVGNTYNRGTYFKGTNNFVKSICHTTLLTGSKWSTPVGTCCSQN